MVGGQLVDNLHHLVVSVVVPHHAVVLHRLQQARHLLHLLLPGSKTVSLSIGCLNWYGGVTVLLTGQVI